MLAHINNTLVKDGVRYTMAMIKFRDCLASELNSQEKIPGSFIICRDTGDMYCDTLDNERVTIAKTIHQVQGPVTGELFPEDGHLYYSITDRQVCVYHDGEFMPINVAIGFKKIENCYCPKGDEVEIEINPQEGGDRLDGSSYGGTIISVLPYKLYTDLSIIDLDGNLVDGGYVAFNGITRSSEGIWSINIANSNNNLDWIGSANVMVFVTTDYQRSRT